MHAHCNHDRNDQENNQCQKHIDPHQDDKCDHELHPGDKKFFRAVMRKFGHIKQIVRNPSHDLSDLGIIIIGIRQLMQMLIRVPAHVRFDFRAHDMSDARHIISGNAVHYAQRQINRNYTQNCLNRQFCQMIQSLIGNVTHNHRQHQLAQCRQPGAE